MATLLDVICEILQDPWETNIFASLMGLSRRLRRFAQMATLQDVICGILWKAVGGYYIRFAHGVVPQMTQICTDGYATGCYLWDSAESVGD